MAHAPHELAEFATLSRKVANREATPEELARWNQLRKLLVSTPPPVGDSQRAHERAGKKLRVAYVPMSAMVVTSTDELGAGGVRLRVKHKMEEGALIILRLELGQPDAWMMVQGRAAWVRKESGHFVVGVEFVALSDDQRQRIEAAAHAGGLED